MDDFDFEPMEPSDDYDIYSGANWSGDEDRIDPWEAAYEARAEAQAVLDAEDAQSTLAEESYWAEHDAQVAAAPPFWNTDETLTGLGEVDGSDA